MITNQRVLVTGGGGFIGSHVVERLATENVVTVLDDFSTGDASHLDLPDERIIEGDVCDPDVVESAVDDQDVVVHMAAMMGVQRTLERPLEVLEVNIDGTRTVLDACVDADVDRIVFASTSEVYGDAPDVPYHETDAMAPETNYAVAKHASERFVQAYSATTDLEFTILRYFNVYGPRQDSSPYGYVIAIFVDRALAGASLQVHGDGRQTRDFTYIDDAVDATVAALGPAGRNETFNVGTGTETSIHELATVVSDRFGGVEPVHVDHPRPYVIERRCADVSRVSERLGYEPSTSLSTGIERTAAAIDRNRTESRSIHNR